MVIITRVLVKSMRRVVYLNYALAELLYLLTGV
jgi:hypothetical protein